MIPTAQIAIIAAIAAATILIGWKAGRYHISDVEYFLPRAGAYPTRSTSGLQTVVIHHTGGELGLIDYAQQHIDQNWPGLGYHYFINRSGDIFKANDPSFKTWHNDKDNTTTIGIGLQGNFNNTPPSESQYKSLEYLLFRLSKQYPTVREIQAHRDYKNTTCPGSLMNWPRVKRSFYTAQKHAIESNANPILNFLALLK